jgi:hypothetical protein
MVKKFLGGTAPSPPPSEPVPELDALRKRVAELEERLEKPTLGKRSSRRKKKRSV